MSANNKHELTTEEREAIFRSFRRDSKTDDYPLSTWDTISGSSTKLDYLRESKENQPFNSRMGFIQYFRIPAIYTLNNGWLLAAADARWLATIDSPHNIDGIYALSKDNGNTWDYKVFNYFVDHANNASSLESASFIDPAISQTSDGTIHYLVDAHPAYGGMMPGHRMGVESTGFDEDGRLYIQHGIADTSASTSIADYSYRLDLSNSTISHNYAGQERSLYPITNEQGEEINILVDAWFNTYTCEDNYQNIQPILTRQKGSDLNVHNNIFYFQSEWKIYPVTYDMYRSGKVTDDGIEWSLPQLLNIKYAAGELFTGVCPGRGLPVYEDGHEYNLFVVYDNHTGKELASVLRYDVENQTWERGERALDRNNLCKSSESQLVKLNGNTIRMYQRNDIDHITYTDSEDFGRTWSDYKVDEDLPYTSNCMISFINIPGSIHDEESGTTYTGLLAASYPKGGEVDRTEGVVRIGSYDENNEVTWLNNDETLIPGFFAYSCLTFAKIEDEGYLHLLYENEPGAITLNPYKVDDLLDRKHKYIN